MSDNREQERREKALAWAQGHTFPNAESEKLKLGPCGYSYYCGHRYRDAECAAKDAEIERLERALAEAYADIRRVVDREDLRWDEWEEDLPAVRAAMEEGK